MKFLILFCVVICLNVMLVAQVSLHTITASKEYANKTRTSYIQLDQAVSKDQAFFISNKIVESPDVSRFSFFDESNYSLCMFSSDISIDEIMIVDMINDIITNDRGVLSDLKRGFENSGFANGYYFYSFAVDEIDDENMRNEIHLILKESDIISDVNYKGDFLFEVYSLDPLYPDDVENLLEKMDVHINENYIK